MWWKKHQGLVIVTAAVLLILAIAFCYGVDTAALHGWQTKNQDDTAQQTALTEETEKTEVAAEAAEEAATEDEAEEDDEAAAGDKDGAGSEAKTEAKAEAKTEAAPASGSLHCTVSISCATVLQHQDQLDAAKDRLIPSGGTLLSAREVSFKEGESVFDVLQRTCREQGIHLEFSETPLYDSAYIEGIGNLYEFDCGELSGWMYSVNGWFPNYGCSRYRLSDGDVIAWVYTCDLGADVGGGSAAQ